MALTEETVNDKIETLSKGTYKIVGVRTATIIKKDGVELTRAFNRHSVAPDADISGEPTEVQAICNAAWTDAIKSSWATYKASLE